MDFLKKLDAALLKKQDSLVEKIMIKASSMMDLSNTKFYNQAKYKVAIVVYNFYKIIIMLALLTVLGLHKYCWFFIFTYNILRFFSHGIHLISPLACSLWDLINYFGATYLGIFLGNFWRENPSFQSAALGGMLVIYFVIAVLFLIYAPASTTNKIIKAVDYKPLKIKSVITLIAVCAVGSIFWAANQYEFSSLVFLASVSQTINLLPKTYTIFGQHGVNFKTR